ncbi:hypothetical protein [Desulfovibrio inopinatus]|uniref:hypothetical protein n=1 Tax=Desulfovibrio inopinatus TaxID=102109 RepID=UPI00041B682F|nr:hypothetical protein [Desulfovibrio inopinatus]
MGLATIQAYASAGASVAIADINEETVIWLSNSALSFVIGHALVLDGGYTIP